MMSILRRFSTSSPRAASFFSRTTIAPGKNYNPHIPTNINPQLAIFLSTPQNLPKTIENAIFLHKQMELQIVVAGIDRSVPNGVRNGVSELWMDSPMHIGTSTLLSEKDKNPELRESDGISPVGAKINWEHIDGNLHLRFGDNEVDLALANTAFATNNLVTLFYFQKSKPASKLDSIEALLLENMGQTLSDLHVTLPQLTPALKPPVSADRWIPISKDKILTITSCTGNLVKSIKGQSAAQILAKNKKLMALASKDTKVYVKLYTQNSAAAPKKYEVIAGGGGWGMKADLLAVSPKAQLKKGDRLEFYMVTPADRFSSPDQSNRSVTATPVVVSQQFLFECTPEATTYDGEQTSTSQTVDHLFGGGSELGFVVNGVNYMSPGESISFGYAA